jgi:2-polyprenyl-6-methoxyphenol hydroxylase-like FAD-dependent oxidoreductase
MKVVIIGGGIAGLTLGIFLRKKNKDVVICERVSGRHSMGHAFLMHTDGLSILNDLNSDNIVTLPGKRVDAFSLRRPCGKEIKRLQLNSWQCIKRVDLIRFLYSLFPNENIKEGRLFSHFIYESGKAIAAVFMNGEVEYGDLFVGADGGNSKVREQIFGKVKFTPVKVKEVVGVCSKNKKISKSAPSVFIKFQNKTNGLAFGMIPTSGTEFVWFMQYDPSISDVADSTPQELGAFCHKLLKSFPPIVANLLEANDFSTSYVWNTRDFDLLPTFHKQNVVLIGDAAHLALPFTSAGTTNAIVDAKILAQCLEYADDYEKAFSLFYELRAEEISQHIHLGRELKNLFLNPNNQSDDDIPVPLITRKEDDAVVRKK